MKKLEEVVSDISPIVTPPDVKQNTSAHGSINTGGKTNTQIQQQQRQETPLIKDRETYQSIKSLRQRVQPQYEWFDNGKGCKERRALLVPVTPEEQAILDKTKLPASREILASILARLAAHKKCLDGEDRLRFMIREIIDWLEAQNAKEWEAWAAIDDIICNHESPYFPHLSAVVTALRKLR